MTIVQQEKIELQEGHNSGKKKKINYISDIFGHIKRFGNELVIDPKKGTKYGQKMM